MDKKRVIRLATFIFCMTFLILFVPAYSKYTYTTMYTVPYGEFQKIEVFPGTSSDWISTQGEFRVSVFRDSDSPYGSTAQSQYVIDPNGTTILKKIGLGTTDIEYKGYLNTVVADKVYDSSDNSYVVDLTDGSATKTRLNTLRVDGTILMSGPSGKPPQPVYGRAVPLPDVSEGILTTDDVVSTDVVVIDPEVPERVKRSYKAYDTTVAGIIAENPFLYVYKKEGFKPLALAGRVNCKVTLEGGAIKRGDLLVTSSTPGHAMKADSSRLSYGMVIGKALQNFDPKETNQDKGQIIVLVNVQ